MVTVELGLPFDPALAESLLEDVSEVAIATMPERGRSRLPMELQTSATFILDTVDYLMTGAEDINATFEEIVEQVSLRNWLQIMHRYNTVVFFSLQF